MPTIAAMLKDQISRLARRAIKKDIEALKKTASRYRRDISGLKRQLAQLERQLGKQTESHVKPKSDEHDSDIKFRFRPEGLKKHRERLGLSAASTAKLLSVSPPTLYNWENGKTRPRNRQLVRLAELRKLGKREASARLSVR